MGEIFRAWPKIPRLFRDCVITEKIDGTNAAVVILPDTTPVADVPDGGELFYDHKGSIVLAQSRSRLLVPGKTTDNYGFAEWVQKNAESLIDVLGHGYHFGEWYGAGIQRGYGLSEKRFALFNTARWSGEELDAVPGLGVVPVLYEGEFHTAVVSARLTLLGAVGSSAVPGFRRPEGVVVHHLASKQNFKVLLENDADPKGQLVSSGA